MAPTQIHPQIHLNHKDRSRRRDCKIRLPLSIFKYVCTKYLIRPGFRCPPNRYYYLNDFITSAIEEKIAREQPKRQSDKIRKSRENGQSYNRTADQSLTF